jgi:hypothetical protein
MRPVGFELTIASRRAVVDLRLGPAYEYHVKKVKHHLQTNSTAKKFICDFLNLFFPPTCRNIVNVSSLLDNDESNTICRNVGNYTSNNIASNARRTKPSCKLKFRLFTIPKVIIFLKLQSICFIALNVRL